MGNRKSDAGGSAATALAPPRHALEAAEAGAPRSISAVRRAAGKIASALNDAVSDHDLALTGFCVDAVAGGRRDQFDGLFTGDLLWTAITIEPVHVPALLALDPALPALLVESRYGGRISKAEAGPVRRTGAAEARECARLAAAFAAALQQSCDDRVPLSAVPIGPLPGEDAAALIAAGEAVARLDFTLALPPHANPLRLTLILPYAAMRPTSVLQLAMTPRDPGAQQRWHDALARRAGDIAMPARSVIARPLLSMQQLMALRPGDVIPIGMPRRVPLLVADRRIATGTIGERDGRVAFMIDQLEQEDAR